MSSTPIQFVASDVPNAMNMVNQAQSNFIIKPKLTQPQFPRETSNLFPSPRNLPLNTNERTIKFSTSEPHINSDINFPVQTQYFGQPVYSPATTSSVATIGNVNEQSHNNNKVDNEALLFNIYQIIQQQQRAKNPQVQEATYWKNFGNQNQIKRRSDSNLTHTVQNQMIVFDDKYATLEKKQTPTSVTTQTNFQFNVNNDQPPQNNWDLPMTTEATQFDNFTGNIGLLESRSGLSLPKGVNERINHSPQFKTPAEILKLSPAAPGSSLLLPFKNCIEKASRPSQECEDHLIKRLYQDAGEGRTVKDVGRRICCALFFHKDCIHRVVLENCKYSSPHDANILMGSRKYELSTTCRDFTRDGCNHGHSLIHGQNIIQILFLGSIFANVVYSVLNNKLSFLLV